MVYLLFFLMIDNNVNNFPLNWPMEWWPVNIRKELPPNNCYDVSSQCSRDSSYPYNTWDILKLSIVVLATFILALCICYLLCHNLKIKHAFKKSLICAIIIALLSAVVRAILWEIL